MTTKQLVLALLIVILSQAETIQATLPPPHHSGQSKEQLYPSHHIHHLKKMLGEVKLPEKGNIINGKFNLIGGDKNFL